MSSHHRTVPSYRTLQQRTWLPYVPDFACILEMMVTPIVNLHKTYRKSKRSWGTGSPLGVFYNHLVDNQKRKSRPCQRFTSLESEWSRIKVFVTLGVGFVRALRHHWGPTFVSYSWPNAFELVRGKFVPVTAVCRFWARIPSCTTQAAPPNVVPKQKWMCLWK